MIPAFAYVSPKTVEQVVSSLDDSWTKTGVLAGGTDLLNMMKEGLLTPAKIVSLKAVDSLNGIVAQESGVKIGAMTSLAEIATNTLIRRSFPALADAAAVIGGPQIRNMGTLGGNLCQRNRDWYFRLGLAPAVREEGQYGPLFSVDGASYVHPSTLAPALLIYDATIHIVGPEGARSIPFDQLFQTANDKSKREVTLAPREVITNVTLTIPKDFSSADYEVRERDSHDWPLVQACAGVRLVDGKVDKVSLAVGHVAPTPMRLPAVEQSLVGKTLNEESALAAGKLACSGAKPAPKAEYKQTLLQVAVKRALLAAAGNPYWRTK